MKAQWFGESQREAVKLQRELRNVSKEFAWSEKVAKEGKVGAYISQMRENTEKWRKSIQGVTTAATVAFGMGTAAVASFVASASPEAMSTFTGSLQLLTGEIGTAFLPIMVQASAWLQETAHWFNSLSDAGKQSIGIWTATAIGMAGVVMILPRIIAGISALLTGVRALIASLAVLKAFNPWLAGLAVVAGGLLTLGAGAGVWAGANSMMGNKWGEGGGAGGLSDAARQRMQERILAIEHEKADINRRRGELQKRGVDPWDIFSDPKGQIAKLDDERKNIQSRMRLADGMAPKKPLAIDYPAHYRPQYMDALSAYKGIHLAGLGTSPLEAEKLKMQNENRNRWIQMAKDVGRIATKVELIKGAVN